MSAVISVAYAWATGRHLYDMGISFSAYVGLQHRTSVMHFVFIAAVVVMMAVYIAETKLPLIKKIVYAVILTAIFGTAFFPFNTFSDAPTAITVDMHNYFAVGLMLATAVSFVLSMIKSKNKKHRITAAVSLAYAAGFIAA